MAKETELERLVVRLVGDNSNLTKAYQQATRQTQQTSREVASAGRDMEKGLEPGAAAIRKIDLSVRDLRKSMSLMAAAGAIDPQAAHTAFLMAEGFNIAKGAVGGLTDGMSKLKVALVSTGIGALVVGAGVLVGWLTHLSEEAAKAREAAKAVFATVVSGARTTAQALDDVRINTLTEGMQELADVVNPGFWRSIWNGLQGAVGLNPVERKIRDILTRAEEAERLALRLASDPRLQRVSQEAALRRNIRASQDAAMSLSEEADRSHLAEAAASRFAQAQRTARESSISLTQALRLLQPVHARLAADQERISANRVNVEIVRDLEDQASRAGMAADASTRMAVAQRFAWENSINLSQALQRLAPLMERMRVAQERSSQSGVRTGVVRQMEEEADRAGLLEGASRRMAIAQQFAFDNSMSLGQALRILAPELERVRVAQNQTSIRTFTQGVREQTATIGLSSERARLFMMSMEGVADANITAALAEVRHLEALRALQAGLEDIQGARAGSTEALGRIAQFSNQFAAAARGANIRQRLMENQQSGAASPAGAASLAGSVAAIQAQRLPAVNRNLLGGGPGGPLGSAAGPLLAQTPPRPEPPPAPPRPAGRRVQDIPDAEWRAMTHSQRQAAIANDPTAQAGTTPGSLTTSATPGAGAAAAGGIAASQPAIWDQPGVMGNPLPPAAAGTGGGGGGADRVERLLEQMRSLLERQLALMAPPQPGPALANLGGGGL